MLGPTRARALGFLAALFVAVPLALVGASPAHAVTADSVPRDQLGACGDILAATKGGWTGPRDFVSLVNQSSAPYEWMRPLSFRLGELCTPNNTTFGVRFTASAPQNWPRNLVASAGFGAWSKGMTLSCYDASNAPVSFTVTEYKGIPTPVPDTYASIGALTYTMPTGCARLRELKMEVQYGTSAQGVWPNTTAVVEVTWSAARSIAGTDYVYQPPTGLGDVCADESVQWSVCEPLRVKDRAGWGDTCGEPDNAAAYGVTYPGTLTLIGDSFDFGTWLSWHAACLFYPLDGFDKSGVVKTAWEASPNAEIGEEIVGMSEAFAYAPGCGVLASTGSGSVLPGFTLDTCTWTWATPVKVVLGIGVLILGFWAFIAYVVRAVSGVIRKDVPSPVEAS